MKATQILQLGPSEEALPRELAHRSSDGVDVALVWQLVERHDDLRVLVEDARSGVTLELEVRSGERALDVFHHPFAYAAARGLGTRVFDPRRDTMVLADVAR